MRTCILAIGDEIVAGTTLDTNSAFIAGQIRAVGAEPIGGFSVADDEAAMAAAIERALADADLVITTGGLGPTADDLTTAVVARIAGMPLQLHEPSLRLIEERFRSRGIEMSPNNRKQAMFPEGSTVVPNPIGTAPGFITALQRNGGERHVICLPGVPRETERMVPETVIPWIADRNPRERFASRAFSTFGLAEAKLDELMVGVIDPSEARLAFRAAFPRVQVRLTVRGAPGADLEGRLDALAPRVRERLGTYLYATGDAGMEDMVGAALRELKLTLAVAESCTGGLIGHRLTDVAGASAYFLLGVVAYSNIAKESLLGVRAETLAAHGAVSTEVAEEMARGVRAAGGADLGLATTGVAGPGGGTPAKPVGTVCIALAWDGGIWSHRYQLGDRSRDWVKAMGAQLALDRVRRWGLGER
ncbi:MAG TPA: competence/damage-inducible protein A [Longimicrobiaceae bacterium]|nr:competence/damage-inducible protein A [Longimicrobiaceae bacterium]